MHQALLIFGGVVILAIFVWLMIPAPGKKGGASGSRENNQVIDPYDTMQIGALIGMMGGSVADVSTVRYALQRFEKIHGRKATVSDMGIVAGLIDGMR